MSAASLVEQIRRIARREAERVLKLSVAPRLANIVEWDRKTHRAKVELQPDGVVTNWIPVASPWIGNGWGVLASHSIGDQVMVVFPEFGSNQGVVIGRIFDERNPPPQVDADIILVNGKGAWIGLKDGKLGINGQAEVDISTTKGDLKMTITGNTTIKSTGTVTIDGATINFADGGHAVARVGDTVVCPAGQGTITTGSKIVNSG